MSKIDFLDAYMRVWIHLEYLLWIAFVVPPHSLDQGTLIGFHLSLPMGYVYSSLYFCCKIDMVLYLANHNWDADSVASPHPLSALADTPPSPDDDSHSGIITQDLNAFISMRLPQDSFVALLHYIGV